MTANISPRLARMMKAASLVKEQELSGCATYSSYLQVSAKPDSESIPSRLPYKEYIQLSLNSVQVMGDFYLDKVANSAPTPSIRPVDGIGYSLANPVKLLPMMKGHEVYQIAKLSLSNGGTDIQVRLLEKYREELAHWLNNFPIVELPKEVEEEFKSAVASKESFAAHLLKEVLTCRANYRLDNVADYTGRHKIELSLPDFSADDYVEEMLQYWRKVFPYYGHSGKGGKNPLLTYTSSRRNSRRLGWVVDWCNIQGSITYYADNPLFRLKSESVWRKELNNRMPMCADTMLAYCFVTGCHPVELLMYLSEKLSTSIPRVGGYYIDEMKRKKAIHQASEQKRKLNYEALRESGAFNEAEQYEDSDGNYRPTTFAETFRTMPNSSEYAEDVDSYDSVNPSHLIMWSGVSVYEYQRFWDLVYDLNIPVGESVYFNRSGKVVSAENKERRNVLMSETEKQLMMEMLHSTRIWSGDVYASILRMPKGFASRELADAFDFLADSRGHDEWMTQYHYKAFSGDQASHVMAVMYGFVDDSEDDDGTEYLNMWDRLVKSESGKDGSVVDIDNLPDDEHRLPSGERLVKVEARRQSNLGKKHYKVWHLLDEMCPLAKWDSGDAYYEEDKESSHPVSTDPIESEPQLLPEPSPVIDELSEVLGDDFDWGDPSSLSDVE